MTPIPASRHSLARVAAFAAAFLLPLAAATAQDIPEEIAVTPEVRAAYFELAPLCAEDARAFCSDVRPGNARVTRCVISHVEELSPVCKAKVEEKIAELFPQQ